MSAAATLTGSRVVLPPWRGGDREPLAAMNADPRVMKYFHRPLSRAESGAMVDRIEAHFAKRGFGLWALAVAGVAPFVGFTDLALPGFEAHFTPCVEIGWRLAFPFWGRGLGHRAARLALGHGFATLGLAEIVSFTSATNGRSRAVMERLGSAAIPPMISIIRRFRRDIRSGRTSAIDFVRMTISPVVETGASLHRF